MDGEQDALRLVLGEEAVEKAERAERSGLRPTRRQLFRSAAIAGAAAGIPGFLAACASGTNASGGQGNFPSHPGWKFAFINHAYDNPFFQPTVYGIQDACALLGLPTASFQGAGNVNGNDQVTPMLDKLNAAISAKVDGIAISLIDPQAFNDPVARALDAGIPVVAYNADVPTGSPNRRMAYIGQDLFLSGQKLGGRIASLVKEGSIAGFIATPGSLNIQPRIDGAKQAIQASGLPIEFTEIATGKAVNDELNAIEAYYLGHKDLKGMVAVDAGSTQGVAQIMQKYGLSSKGVHAGGYDLLSGTIQGIQQGSLDFTIDQQPYAQGFYPVVQLFLYKLSGGLASPSDTNTGLVFVTKSNVNPYLAKTRFEGSSSKEQVVNPSAS
jgi:simple sugar transport system substrate-binding protein